MKRTNEEVEEHRKKLDEKLQKCFTKANSRNPVSKQNCLYYIQRDVLMEYYPRMDEDSQRRARYTIRWIGNGATKLVDPKLTIE